LLRTRYAMFDFSEILIIFGLALVVLGPKKLPGAAAQIGRWLGRARAMARQFREQLEEEVNSVKDFDSLSKRPAPPVYTPPPAYTPPAPSTTESGTMTHPASTESPSEWLSQTAGGTAETPPELVASPTAEPDLVAPEQSSAMAASPAAVETPPSTPAAPFAHEDPQTTDHRTDHERGT
jgi:sec-independent protein translocase protein TatB